MSAFLMVVALIIACIVLAQQFVILHRQNKQLMAYSYYVDGFFAAIKTVKDAVDKINSAFVQHAVDTIQENVKQEQFRGKYYKRRDKTAEAAQNKCPECESSTDQNNNCTQQCTKKAEAMNETI